MKTPEEYLNSKGFYNTNRLLNCFGEEITITDMLREYATEAIKADRERISGITRIWQDENHPNWRTLRESILALPYDLK